MPKRIFYSWLSDIAGNKQFLLRLLERFVSEYPEYVIEAADRNPKGADDIAHVIIKKIESSDYFVGDISLINPEDIGVKGRRVTSNPNVLYEVGYASALKKVQKILIANKLTTPDSKELPFDIRNRRHILEEFTDKKAERLYSHLEYALTIEQDFPSEVLATILHDTVKALKLFHNPEYVVEFSSEGTLNSELSYFFDFVRPKLPALKRSVGKHEALYDMTFAYIEAMKVYSKIQPELGIENYEQRLKVANEIVGILNEVVGYIVDNNLAEHRSYTTEIDEFKEQVKDWAANELPDESNYNLSSFYRFHTSLDLFYNQFVMGGTKDDTLTELADNLQPVMSRRLDQFELDERAQKILESLK
jgi:hypothetical protein